MGTDEFQDAEASLKGWSVISLRKMEERLGVPSLRGTASTHHPWLQSKRFDAGLLVLRHHGGTLKTLDFVSQRKIGTSFAYPADSKLEIKTAADACGPDGCGAERLVGSRLLEKLNDNECKDNPVTMQTHGTQAQAELAVRSPARSGAVAGSVKLAYMASRPGT